MSDLTEFLLARIAEDEAVAKATVATDWAQEKPWLADVVTSSLGRVADCSVETDHRHGAAADAAHIARWDPGRVLAECEAKRRIIGECAERADSCDMCGGWIGHEDDCNGDPEQARAERILRALAEPYADHPDFRPEWRR